MTIEEMQARVQRASGLHGGIARDVWPNGARLRCERCGRVQAASTADCGGYLARGWPTCCGLTMTLESAAPTPGARDAGEEATGNG